MKNQSFIILPARNNQCLHWMYFLQTFFSAHIPGMCTYIYVYKEMRLYNTYQFVIDLNKLRNLL